MVLVLVLVRYQLFVIIMMV